MRSRGADHRIGHPRPGLCNRGPSSPPGADHIGVSYIALFDLFKPGPDVLSHRRLRMRRPYLPEGVLYSHTGDPVANSGSRHLVLETMPGHGRWSTYALESFS